MLQVRLVHTSKALHDEPIINAVKKTGKERGVDCGGGKLPFARGRSRCIERGGCPFFGYSLVTRTGERERERESQE